MVGIQSVRSLTPKGTDTLIWDDIESKRRTVNSSNSTTTTFDIITRRFTTFASSTSSHDIKVTTMNADDLIRQIKLRLIKYNPMIFQMLREYLIARRCFTAATVSCTLHQFIDVELRLPELRSDIMNHQLSYTRHHSYKNINTSTSSMFFAYLTGESFSPSTIVTPNKQITPTSLTRSVTSSSFHSDSSTSQYSQELSLPSLPSFGQLPSGNPDDLVNY
jgi:hypothetical protein